MNVMNDNSIYNRDNSIYKIAYSLPHWLMMSVCNMQHITACWHATYLSTCMFKLKESCWHETCLHDMLKDMQNTYDNIYICIISTNYWYMYMYYCLILTCVNIFDWISCSQKVYKWNSTGHRTVCLPVYREFKVCWGLQLPSLFYVFLSCLNYVLVIFQLSDIVKWSIMKKWWIDVHSYMYTCKTLKFLLWYQILIVTRESDGCHQSNGFVSYRTFQSNCHVKFY